MVEVLSFIRRFWWAPLLAAALLWGVLGHSDARRTRKALAQEKALHALDNANFRAASAKAQADNLADVRATESDAAVITETKQHDLETQLADARALAARYAGRMRCETAANPGSPSKTDLSEAPRPTSDPVGTGGMSLVDDVDLQACSTAVVKARGWQAFYGELRARYNAETAP